MTDTIRGQRSPARSRRKTRWRNLPTSLLTASYMSLWRHLQKDLQVSQLYLLRMRRRFITELTGRRGGQNTQKNNNGEQMSPMFIKHIRTLCGNARSPTQTTRLPPALASNSTRSPHQYPCRIPRQRSQVPPRDPSGRGQTRFQAKQVGYRPISRIVRHGCRACHSIQSMIKTTSPKSSIVANSRSSRRIPQCRN